MTPVEGDAVDANTPAARLALIADELRSIAAEGLIYATREKKVYDEHRYERIRRLAAEAAALAINEDAAAIEAAFEARPIAMSPVLAGEGAVFDATGRLLLIRRADNKLWALPGGLLEVGEGAAEGSCREVFEETGVACQATGLVGIYDNRRQKKHGPFHLLHLVFVCEALDPAVEPKVMPECIDVGWFAEDDLPELSPGHEVRIPDVFRFGRGDTPTAHDG
ncbi:MAG: NUDIX hydrolase N-terminal domain-containing protein [Acidimicrobiales bacterium]